MSTSTLAVPAAAVDSRPWCVAAPWFSRMSITSPLSVGLASIQSTDIYLRVDPSEMLDSLAIGTPPTLKRGKFHVPDKRMAMFKEVGRQIWLCKASTACVRR